MKYYWLNHCAYKPGDIIQPGGWGRGVLGTPNHRWLKMEMQFEQARLLINPSLPSRLECAFVSNDNTTIKLLVDSRPNDYLYEVDLIDKDKPIYVADMALVHPELEIYNAHLANPKKYWSFSQNEKRNWPETLTLSRLQVVGPVRKSQA